MKKNISLILLVFFISHAAYAATIRELYERAVDAYNQQDYDKAIAYYQDIIKETPLFAPAYVGIGLALKSKNGDIDEVLYYYKTATEMDPTSSAAFEQLGRLYYSMNKFVKSEKAFLKALKIDPGLVSVKSALGWVYLLGKPNPGLAVKYFKSALKVSPTPDLYFGLGMAYFANNDRVEAIEMITTLRKMQQEEFAQRLEQMVRSNRKVQVEPSSESDDPHEQAEEVSAGQGTSTPAIIPSQATTQVESTGYRVRLRGKLSDIK